MRLSDLRRAVLLSWGNQPATVRVVRPTGTIDVEAASGRWYRLSGYSA